MTNFTAVKIICYEEVNNIYFGTDGSSAVVRTTDRQGSMHRKSVQNMHNGASVGRQACRLMGDSMTDPRNNSKDVPKKYWNYLQEMLGITPYVYGVSRRQWDDIPRQAEKLKSEHGDSVDAITVFIGTNDFNAGVPIGRWYEESEGNVTAAVHGERKEYKRKRRMPAMDKNTFKGRINIAVERLKTLFPDKQIVLLTPIHRGKAEFGEYNLQPDESWQNVCGEYFSAYVEAVKEAGNVWGVAVVDLNAVSGMNPMVEAQQQYFRSAETDLLHPSDKGQRRLALTLATQLAALPVF